MTDFFVFSGTECLIKLYRFCGSTTILKSSFFNFKEYNAVIFIH